MYDADWAEGIYGEFWEEHLLACRETNRLYNVSVKAVLGVIMSGSDRWRGYKKLVKHVEKTMSIYWKHFHSYPGVREKYLTFDKYLKVQLKRVCFTNVPELVDSGIQLGLYF